MGSLFCGGAVYDGVESQIRADLAEREAQWQAEVMADRRERFAKCAAWLEWYQEELVAVRRECERRRTN
jgi:hypothetical protein